MKRFYYNNRAFLRPFDETQGYLDSEIPLSNSPVTEKENTMAKCKIDREVMVNGVGIHIRANSEQEYADKLLSVAVMNVQTMAPAAP